MLNLKVRRLRNEIENQLMQCGCDTTWDSVVRYVDTEGMTLREISQAYAMAVCYAASAHIENCYDTPDSECTDGRGKLLTVSHYVNWMHRELSNPLLQV